MNQTRNRRRCCDSRVRRPVRGLFDGPPEDNIGRLVVSNFAEPKAVMNIVSAVAHAGRAAEVMAFGVEMQQVLTSTTGQPAGFVVGISGVFGGTRFAVGADSMASLEDANEKPSRRHIRQAHGEGRRPVRTRHRTVGDPPQDQLAADPGSASGLEGGPGGGVEGGGESGEFGGILREIDGTQDEQARHDNQRANSATRHHRVVGPVVVAA